MSENKLFSVQSNGYDINEVDDYINFIQCELTKNMKLNRDVEIQKNNLNEKIDNLEKEIDLLSKKNSKLYKDCVAFAKRLKSLEVYDIIPSNTNVCNLKDNENISVDENSESKNIVDESIKQLAAEYEDLKKELDLAFSQMDNLKNENTKLQNENSQLKDSLHKNEFVDINSSDNDEDYFDYNYKEKKEVNNAENNITNANTSTNKEIKTKKKPFNSFINFITMLFIVVTVFVIFISTFSYIFIKVPELSFFNYRSFTVQSNDLQPNYNLNDIVITKKQNVDNIKTGSYIIIKSPDNNGNIIQRVTGINHKNNIYTFELKNNTENKSFFTINKSKSLFIVDSKISKIGKIAIFAFKYPLLYFAIILMILLISFILRLLFLSPKTTKRKKFTAEIPDYTLNI